jgi:hypothetical protein
VQTRFPSFQGSVPSLYQSRPRSILWGQNSTGDSTSWRQSQYHGQPIRQTPSQCHLHTLSSLHTTISRFRSAYDVFPRLASAVELLSVPRVFNALCRLAAYSKHFVTTSQAFSETSTMVYSRYECNDCAAMRRPQDVRDDGVDVQMMTLRLVFCPPSDLFHVASYWPTASVWQLRSPPTLLPKLRRRRTPPQLIHRPPTCIRVHDARPRQHHPCDRTLMDRPPIARRQGRLHRAADP